MKRLEFGFFDAGGGHRAAATALKMAIEGQQRPWEVELANLQEILDPLDILKKLTGIRIQDLYNDMLRNGWTLGSPQLLKVLQLVVRINHTGGVRLLEEQWRKIEPDMLVSFVPHFNRIMCESFGNAFPGRPFVTILTDLADYPPHFWIERQCQYVICGSERAVAQARATRHPDNRIFRASGMILHPRFYEPPTEDRVAGRKRLGLRSDVPTGLVLFGGYGSHEIREIAERLDRSKLELQLILICGKNVKLADELRARKWRIPVFVEGFTTKVNEYMHLADFFMGKPGPGSVSEALSMHLPVIVACNAWTLPQERYNADYIVEKQVGVVLKTFRDVERAVAQLIEPSALERFRANTVALKNEAVFEIPAMLEKIFEESRDKAASGTGVLTGKTS
ncbi:MAG TPA: glycosyltransferase [Candidatus Baltobacteraceae bacterium]|nr:glycosyltransferase [Candidatus Baltobacteraceae bacterium]